MLHEVPFNVALEKLRYRIGKSRTHAVSGLIQLGVAYGSPRGMVFLACRNNGRIAKHWDCSPQGVSGRGRAREA